MQPGLKRKNLTGQFTIVCALPLYHVFAFITCGCSACAPARSTS
jgi:long-chain acyl-CoA synthetase